MTPSGIGLGLWDARVCCLCSSGAACTLISFMRFKCGSHNSGVAAGQRNGCPQKHHKCQKCTANEVEDEHQVIFRCSAYEALRFSMHDK